MSKLKAQGKSESSAFAICTASLKKAGKLDEDFIDNLSEIDEGTFEFEELETYLQENALLAWSAPTKRKDIPSSHFFDPKNKKYPYRNSDGSVNCSGVLAAWKMANGARSGKKADSKIISKIKPYRDRCLKQKNPKSKKQEDFHRFSSPIPEISLDQIKLADKDSINIQCLREGKFKHPWYGILDFNQKFFSDLIQNFEADIPNPEIAFDFKHMPDYGAAAWINKFFIEDKNLMANVSLTKRGKESIKDKEFRYFSIEYTDDYVEFEFNEELGEDGKPIERETKISHGPTVLGGGLTNRPFIKGMLPVSLHEGDEIEQIQLTEVKDEFQQSTKEVKESMEKTLEELQNEQKKIQDRIKELEDKGEKSSNEEMDTLIAKLDDISAEVKKLSEEKADGNEDSDDEASAKTLEELDTTKKALEAAKKALEDKDDTVTKLSDDVKSLTDTVAKLMDSNKVLQEDKYRISVDKKLDDFRKLGAFPSTLKIIESIIFSDEAKKFSVTLSEGEGEDKKEVSKGFLDVIEDILASIPEEHRFTENETSESPRTPTGSAKELSMEEVEKYAKENEISLEEAIVHFSKEGLID